MPTPKRNRSAPPAPKAATPKARATSANARAAATPPARARRRPRLAFPALALLAGSAGAYFVLTACGKRGEPPQPGAIGAVSQSSGGGAAEPGPAAIGTGLVDPSDGGGNNLVAIPADAFVDDAAPEEKPKGPMLGAAHFMTFVFEKPDFSSTRLGYLRAGGRVPLAGAVSGEAVKRTKTNACKEGWVTVEPRGYVCLDKGGGSLNLEAPSVRLATAAPNFDDLLPYKYAFNWRNGAPLYRKVPTRDQWLEKEPWLKPAPKKEKAKPKKDEEESPYGEGDSKAEKPDKPEVDLDAATADLADAGAPAEAGAWWERDAGKGEISLKDTVESEGIVARRMAKGFAIAIDRTFAWAGRTWHRTTMGLVAPADSVGMVKASDFKGVELTGDWQLPVAFAMVANAGVYESKDKKSFKGTKDKLKRQSAIRLLAPTAAGFEEVKQGGLTWLPTADGRWVRAMDVVKVEKVAPPPDLKPGEKWVDVSIKGQWLVAYEGEKPVFTTLVSTGRDGTNEKGRFATVQGSYRVREKHVAATMDGDTSGELYSIEDVPYIQYFHTSYAVHGAFWHADFGRVRSHGCVNMSPLDAKRMFFWTEPKIPDGWHAVWATAANPGTRIITRP